MSEELKSCPFCGSTKIFTEPDERGSGGQWVMPIHVGCSECGAEQQCEDIDDVASVWNRRATPPAPSTGPIKDHVLREVVNSLRDVALKFHDHGSLRERLRAELDPLLVAPSTASEVDERAAFEAWLGRPMMNQKEPAHYNGSNVRPAWKAWEARAALAAKTAA